MPASDQTIREERKIAGTVGNLINEQRVMGFSDAVFAFAATLLVLKIDLPQIVLADIDTQFVPAIATLWPQYVANIISFLVIGYYWLMHHAIFSMVRKYDTTLVWINLIFLIALSFLPFPVDLYGDFFLSPVVVVFYTASLALVGFLLAVIWVYVSYHHHLISRDLSKNQLRYYATRVFLAPVILTISLPFVYLYPVFAQFSWLFIIGGIVLTNRYFHKNKPSKIEEVSI